MYDVEIVKKTKRLIELKEQWNHVLGKSSCDSIFLTWEWIITWWRHFGKNKELCIILVKKQNQIVAILPLMKEKEKYLGFTILKIKAIRNNHSPYFDLILTDDIERVIKVAFEYINKLKWDVIELNRILSNSTSIHAIKKLSSRNVIRLVLQETVYRSPYVTVNNNWDHYYGSLSKNLKKNIKRRENKLQILGNTEIESIQFSDKLDYYLEKGFEIEASGWKGKAGTAILCNKNVRNFYSDLAHTSAMKGWLSLSFLKVDYRRIAFNYGLRYKNTINSCKIGYNPDFAKYSPGILLCKMILKNAFEENYKLVNFLGEYQSHKKNWTSSLVAFNEVWIFKKGFFKYLIYLAQFGFKNYFKQYPMIVSIKEKLFHK